MCVYSRHLEAPTDEPCGHEEMRKQFFEKYHEVAKTKQSNPVAHITSVEEVCDLFGVHEQKRRYALSIWVLNLKIFRVKRSTK